MDVETEIGNLKRRLGDLEGAVKVLSGQMGNIHPELVTLGDATMKRFDLIAITMDRLVGRLDSVNTQVWSLRDDMPALMADALSMSRKRID